MRWERRTSATVASRCSLRRSRSVSASTTRNCGAVPDGTVRTTDVCPFPLVMPVDSDSDGTVGVGSTSENDWTHERTDDRLDALLDRARAALKTSFPAHLRAEPMAAAGDCLPDERIEAC